MSDPVTVTTAQAPASAGKVIQPDPNGAIFGPGATAPVLLVPVSK